MIFDQATKPVAERLTAEAFDRGVVAGVRRRRGIATAVGLRFPTVRLSVVGSAVDDAGGLFLDLVPCAGVSAGRRLVGGSLAEVGGGAARRSGREKADKREESSGK